jgi:hypothetical protein
VVLPSVFRREAALSRLLISFDIDGTLEAGDPPGPVTFGMVTTALIRGHVIGSASDRTLAEQRAIWAPAGISVDFTCNKHRLAESTAQFGCDRMLHIGDTATDEYYAGLAGFRFCHVNALGADWAAFLSEQELRWDAAG